MAAETIKELQQKIADLDVKIAELEAKGNSKEAQNKKDKKKAYEAALQIKQAKKDADIAKKDATTKDEKRAIEEQKDQQIAEIKGALTKEESKQLGKYQERKQQDGADFAGIDFDKSIIGGTSVNDIFNGVVDFSKGYLEAYTDPLTFVLGPQFGPIFGGLSAIGATPDGDKTAGIGGQEIKDLEEDLAALEEEQARQSLLDERLKAIDFRSLYLAEGRAATRRGSKSKRREQPAGQAGAPTLPSEQGTAFTSPTTLPSPVVSQAVNTTTNLYNDIMASINSAGMFG